MLANANYHRDQLVVQSIVVVLLIALSVIVPFAVLVTAPALIVVGVREVRAPATPAMRNLGWLALVSGTLLVAIIALTVLGLVAAGGAAMSEFAPVVKELPEVAP